MTTVLSLSEPIRTVCRSSRISPATQADICSAPPERAAPSGHLRDASWYVAREEWQGAGSCTNLGRRDRDRWAWPASTSSGPAQAGRPRSPLWQAEARQSPTTFIRGPLSSQALMNFLIADTFTRLQPPVRLDQKAVKASVFDLQMDPTGNGLQLHRIDKQGPQFLVGAGQSRHPPDRPQDRRQPAGRLCRPPR